MTNCWISSSRLGGTAGGTEIVKNFLKQIKKTYPKTVFHGTDVGHTWHSTGPQYLKYLKSTGQMGHRGVSNVPC
mgnify:CR=1 FL=1